MSTVRPADVHAPARDAARVGSGRSSEAEQHLARMAHILATAASRHIRTHKEAEPPTRRMLAGLWTLRRAIEVSGAQLAAERDQEQIAAAGAVATSWPHVPDARAADNQPCLRRET